MDPNLSNAHNEDEQNIQNQSDEQDLDALFAASYSGDDAEASRLAKTAGDEVVEDTTGAPNEEGTDTVEDDSINIASVDLNEADPAPADPQDPVATDIASLREELHRAKSDAGRVPHLNRRVQELERKLKDASAPALKPDDADELPSTLKQKLEKLKEIDPEVAELFEETYRQSTAATKQLAASVRTAEELQRQREDEAYIHQEYQKVVSAVPEAEAVFRSPEWNRWRDMLTPNHRAMADSSNANEVITALQAFKVDADKHLGGYKWAPTPAAAPQPQVSATARAAENSRANRLTSSATVKQPPARATAELDVDALFNEAYNKVLADNTRPS